MRTTLVIDDEVFRQLKKLAADEGRTLSQVTQEVLKRGLGQPRTPARRRPVKLPSFAMGASQVDVSDRDQLYDVLDRQ